LARSSPSIVVIGRRKNLISVPIKNFKFVVLVISYTIYNKFVIDTIPIGGALVINTKANRRKHLYFYRRHVIDRIPVIGEGVRNRGLVRKSPFYRYTGNDLQSDRLLWFQGFDGPFPRKIIIGSFGSSSRNIGKAETNPQGIDHNYF